MKKEEQIIVLGWGDCISMIKNGSFRKGGGVEEYKLIKEGYLEKRKGERGGGIKVK